MRATYPCSNSRGQTPVPSTMAKRAASRARTSCGSACHREMGRPRGPGADPARRRRSTRETRSGVQGSEGQEVGGGKKGKKGDSRRAAQQSEGESKACWHQTLSTQKLRTSASTAGTEVHCSPDGPTMGTEPQTGVSPRSHRKITPGRDSQRAGRESRQRLTRSARCWATPAARRRRRSGRVEVTQLWRAEREAVGGKRPCRWS